MVVGVGMYDAVVKKFTFAILSPDEFLVVLWCDSYLPLLWALV